MWLKYMPNDMSDICFIRRYDQPSLMLTSLKSINTHADIINVPTSKKEWANRPQT